MKLLEQIYRQRVEFLRRNLQPNRLICPFDLRYQLLGELMDQYGVSGPVRDRKLTVMGLHVLFTNDTSRLEVALCFD